MAALVVLVALLLISQARPKRASGPLPQEVYVWQRAWGPPVVAALARTTTSPPFPPSPPFGPPRGTYFSLRKLTQPRPPSPAFTKM